MLECKDCCLYNTDACRYGRYALEHNMSLNCDDFIVEHNKAYQQGRTDAIKEYKQSDEYIKECVQRYLKCKADKYQEITSAYMLLTEKQVDEIRAEAIDEFVRWAYVHGVDFSFMGKIKEDGTPDVVDRLDTIKSDFYKQLKEQKLCSNGKPCKHPKCNKCGTTHFMSECDYGKEQSNE